MRKYPEKNNAAIKDHWNNDYQDGPNPLYYDIQPSSILSSHPCVGEGSVHFQRNIVIDTGPVYQAAGHSPDSPGLLQPECSILMFTILLFSRIRTFGYLHHHHPAAA